MSSQRNHVISCRVTEKLRFGEFFGFLSWPQLSSLSLTVTMRSSQWVWWRAWPPKQPLSCEIKGNGEKDFLWFSVSFVQNYFCGSAVAKKLPFLNPTPALPVREEEAKRRWRRTLRYRSVTISPKKICPFRENLSVHSFKSFSILIFLSLRRSMWPLRWGAI